jgi:DNA-binding NarL/FixJ family response regulator
MKPRTKTILLADFQFLTRKGIGALIDELPGFEVVAHIDTSEQLYDSVISIKPDVLVLDFIGNDPKFLKEIKRIRFDTGTEILIITNSQSQNAIQYLLSVGVNAIVTKSCSESEIINAMTAASNGKRFFCHRVLDWVVEDKVGRGEDCEPTTLSPREIEVLNLIIKGYSTIRIAKHLCISTHTINTHRKNMLRKLNLKTPAELIVFALRSGLANA